MSTKPESKSSDAPAKRAEAKDDPNIKAFRDQALKIAANRAKATEEQMEAQRRYDALNNPDMREE